MEQYLNLSKYNDIKYIYDFPYLRRIWGKKLKEAPRFHKIAERIFMDYYNFTLADFDINSFGEITIYKFLESFVISGAEVKIKFYIKDSKILGFNFYVLTEHFSMKTIRYFTVYLFSDEINEDFVNIEKEVVSDLSQLNKVSGLVGEGDYMFPLYCFLCDNLLYGEIYSHEGYFNFYINSTFDAEKVMNLITDKTVSLSNRELCLGAQYKTLDIKQYNTVGDIINCTELQDLLNSPLARCKFLYMQNSVYIERQSYYPEGMKFDKTIKDFLVSLEKMNYVEVKVKFFIEDYWIVGMSYYCLDNPVFYDGDLISRELGTVIFNEKKFSNDILKEIYYNIIILLEKTDNVSWSVDKNDFLVPQYRKLISYFPKSRECTDYDTIRFTLQGKKKQFESDKEWEKLKAKILEETKNEDNKRYN